MTTATATADICADFHFNMIRLLINHAWQEQAPCRNDYPFRSPYLIPNMALMRSRSAIKYIVPYGSFASTA